MFDYIDTKQMPLLCIAETESALFICYSLLGKVLGNSFEIIQ